MEISIGKRGKEWTIERGIDGTKNDMKIIRVIGRKVGVL